MKLWPFGRTEKRAAQGGSAGYTDAVVRALMAHAAGGATADPSATAALEAAAGSYARAFAVADVEPRTPATRALTPALLSLMARDLIRRGEFVQMIDVDRNGVRLVPVGSMGHPGRIGPGDLALSLSDGGSVRLGDEDATGCGRHSRPLLGRPGAAVVRSLTPCMGESDRAATRQP